MTDLADFLRARYAERASRAHSTPGPSWERRQITGGPGDAVVFEDYVAVADADANVVVLADVDADVLPFVLSNDPASVLADIDSKLALVDEHSGTEFYVYTDDGTRACQTCGDTTMRHPCNVLRRLGTPFARHSDYKEDWQAWTTDR